MSHTNHNGTITVSDVIDGQLTKRRYIGYTLAQAKQRFKAHIRAEYNQPFYK
jgi:hypothetical protein